MTCFTFEDLLTGSQEPELPLSVQRHLSDDSCEVCARRLQQARRLLELLPALVLEKPPARVVAAAASVPARVPRVAPLVLEAVLPAPGLVPAFRAGSAAASRRRLYRTGPYELDLALQEDGALVGEVLHEDDGRESSLAGECTLYGEESVAHAQLDTRGCFRFEDIGPGRHALVIEGRDVTLVVAEMVVSP